MGDGDCKAVNADDTLWDFCPSVGAAFLFTVLFAITTAAHFVQAIVYRKGYSWVIILAGVAQTICYVARVASIKNPANVGYYSAWFVLMLCAPLLINAYVYMVLGRMVYNFTSSARMWKIKAWRFTLIFVILDIVALLAQVAGAASAVGKDVKQDQALRGLHIYMGGIGIQQFFIILFTILAVQFHRDLHQQPHTAKNRQARNLLYVLYTALILITVRIIFRLVEYASGFNSTIPRHEAYQYVLDSTLMLFALVLFNVIHPGRIMAGRESDFPSRRERKAYKAHNGREMGGRGDGNNSLLPTSGSSSHEMLARPGPLKDVQQPPDLYGGGYTAYNPENEAPQHGWVK